MSIFILNSYEYVFKSYVTYCDFFADYSTIYLYKCICVCSRVCVCVHIKIIDLNKNLKIYFTKKLDFISADKLIALSKKYKLE